jgi:hypothetical protein
MIAGVGVSPGAIVDDVDVSSDLLAQLHREVVRCLLAHGELTFSSESERGELLTAIVQLGKYSADSAKAWETILTSGRWRVAASPATCVPLEDIEDIDQLRSGWKSLIDIAIVEAVRAELLGCPSDALSVIDEISQIEIAKCRAHWDANTFGCLRDRGERHIVVAGTPRDDVARDYFIPTLANVRHVSLLDRYVGGALARHKGTTPSSPHELEWLIALVDEHAPGATLTLFTAFDTDDKKPFDAAEINDAAEEIWSRIQLSGGLKRFTILVAPAKWISGARACRFPHERHLRVSTQTGASCGFTLPGGFDRLRTVKSREDWRLAYMWQQSDIQGLQREEGRARTASTNTFQFGPT